VTAAEYRLTLPVAEDLLFFIEDELGETTMVQEQLYLEQDLRFPATILAPRYAPLRDVWSAFPLVRDPPTGDSKVGPRHGSPRYAKSTARGCGKR
jgi:hypothetical protein